MLEGAKGSKFFNTQWTSLSPWENAGEMIGFLESGGFRVEKT